MLQDTEDKLRDLIRNAWDREITSAQVAAWLNNFDGTCMPADVEREHASYALTRFMYFGKRLVRELLRALYRDHFRAPLLQRIRRNFGKSASISDLERMYAQELASTRFVGVGNPAESGAHLLYYFRQVNYLSKNLFVDLAGAFQTEFDRQSRSARYARRDGSATRFVFFDDLVGSGVQSSQYLASHLERIRKGEPSVDVRFMSLFATSGGLSVLNSPIMFDGKADCLYELDETFKAFNHNSRYFRGAPSWFSQENFHKIALAYGVRLQPKRALGYRDGQLMLGFSHNTPDNTLPIYWDEGGRIPWFPAFPRFDKL